ncbi:peptidase C14 [Variovorax sp. Root318D1]|uniref:caspase family protein n=1 Tax=Variovorax sp. Root318D1 TaxID=1736513 RepID=UPI0006F5602E|nr:caspase family protein [Variovorax sp. Root318D1]KQU86761.1 peptidase C14 [Variovorax sp. Root318D1]
MTIAARLLCLLMLLAAAGGSAAAQRALLVGVSELVNQPQALWLQAPRNDVMLMRQTLMKQGFAPADVTVLADGVAGASLPEAERINEALARLLEQSRSGDFVVLYFSGHGTRVRDSTKRYQEPDGLAENFLARDARGADASGGSLPGGLRDVDFDRWISAFLARNVFVWSVFDTCSAASMTRGAAQPPEDTGPADDEVRFRGVRAGQLAASGPAAAASPAQALPESAAGVPRARYVAFFASESHQVTPELRLPRKGRNARPQGLLTWAVAEALQQKPATWRDLFNGVLNLYPAVIEELESRFPARELPSPVAEGNLDLPIFANALAPLSTRPVWRAERAGGSLTLKAGLLDGLEPGQDLRVVATLADGIQRTAQGRLVQADLGNARLAVPSSLAELAQATSWSATPVAEPALAALRVRSDSALPGGLSLDYPASIRTAGEAQADVRWVDLGAAGGRLELLSPALAATAEGGSAQSGIVVRDMAEARVRLQALAQLKWMSRLAELAKDGRLDGFDAVLEVRDESRVLRSANVRDAAGGTLQLRPGERAELMVRNGSGQSIDLVVVGVDAQGVLQSVYPQDLGEANRFERGTRESPASKRFALPWLKPGRPARLLVLATPAQARSAPRLFGAGTAEAVTNTAELRVRGQLTPERERQVYGAMLRWTNPAAP